MRAVMIALLLYSAAMADEVHILTVGQSGGITSGSVTVDGKAIRDDGRLHAQYLGLEREQRHPDHRKHRRFRTMRWKATRA